MSEVAGVLVSVNVAHVMEQDWKPDVGRTGIDKRPAPGRVRLFDDHVEGDTIADTAHHGGPDQAVYAYAAEDADWWAAAMSRSVPSGAFGENLTTRGLDVTGAVIGERWSIGSSVVEVSCPRIPCVTLRQFWNVPGMLKLFTKAARPGAYLRIVTEGSVGAGDSIGVLSRPAHGVTIGDTFRALMGERELVSRLLDAPELPRKTHEWARGVLAAR